MSKEKVEPLMGYSMKAKAKREFVIAEVHQTAKGGFMIKGSDCDGNSMCAMISKEKALAAIANKQAKKAF